jgi:hypothetical protein
LTQRGRSNFDFRYGARQRVRIGRRGWDNRARNSVASVPHATDGEGFNRCRTCSDVVPHRVSRATVPGHRLASVIRMRPGDKSQALRVLFSIANHPNQSRMISVVKVAFTRNVDQFVTLMWRLKAERAKCRGASRWVPLWVVKVISLTLSLSHAACSE